METATTQDLDYCEEAGHLYKQTQKTHKSNVNQHHACS